MADIDIVTNWEENPEDKVGGFTVPFPQIRKHSLISDDDDIVVSEDASVATIIPEDGEEKAKDDLGYTNPNLHRRIDTAEYRDKGHSYFINPSQEEIDEYNLNLNAMPPNEYSLRIHGVNSYRTTTVYLHDDSLKGGPGTGETEIP